MKYKTSLSISALCFLTALLLLLASRQNSQEAMAARIAPEILRFHILAESNSARDQELKLEVRSLLLDYIRRAAPADGSKAELEGWLRDHKSRLRTLCETHLARQGAPASVSLALTKDHFPAKSYGGCVFPSGTYDALRVTIGSGQGHNWWCVLYPSLCIPEGSAGAFPDQSLRLLQELLSPEDYARLLSHAPGGSAQTSSRIQLRSRLLKSAAALLRKLSGKL